MVSERTMIHPGLRHKQSTTGSALWLRALNFRVLKTGVFLTGLILKLQLYQTRFSYLDQGRSSMRKTMPFMGFF